MLKNLLTLTLLLSSAAYASDAWENQLVVHQQVTVRDGKNSLTLQPGQYYAEFKLEKNEIEVEVHLRDQNRIAKVEIEIPKGDRFNLERVQYKAASLGQDFDLSGYSIHRTVSESAQITKAGACVIQSWTSQENCRNVESYVWPSNCDITGKNCTSAGYTKNEYHCDTVNHSITGTNMQTVIPRLKEINQGIALVSGSGAVVADLIRYRDKYIEDERISETQCRM